MKAHVDCLHQLEQLQAAHERLLNEQRIAHAHAATQADQLLAAQRELAQERASHMELVRLRFSSLDEAPTCNLNQCQQLRRPDCRSRRSTQHTIRTWRS